VGRNKNTKLLKDNSAFGNSSKEKANTSSYNCSITPHLNIYILFAMYIIYEVKYTIYSDFDCVK
jgi:hypothetical protein